MSLQLQSHSAHCALLPAAMVKSGEVIWINPKENPKSTARPCARSGHSITCINEKAYLFGGCGVENGAPSVFNDMHLLHISEGFRWEKVDAMGDVPPPRWRHSATLLPDNNTVFLFGGLCKVRPAASGIAARRTLRVSRTGPCLLTCASRVPTHAGQALQ